MRKHHLFSLIAVVMMVSIVLSACQASNPGGVQAVGGYIPMRVATDNCDYGGEIRSIEALDDLRVKFTLCNPDPAFLAKIANPTFSIQDANVLNAAKGDSQVLSQDVVGTGPYKVVEFIPGDRIVLEANPDYWGIPPKNNKITFRWSVSSSVREADLQFASADAANNVSIPSFSRVVENPRFKLYYRSALNVAYLGMNNTIAPFDDERVRQAFANALDRKAIIQTAFPKGVSQAEQLVPSIMKPGYSDILLWWDYNPKNAKDLLTDAGFDFKQTIDLYYPNISSPYLQSPDNVAGIIRDQLAEIGVKVKLVKSADFLSLIQQGKAGLFLYGTIAAYPDPTAIYDVNLKDNSQQFGSAYGDIIEQLDIAGKSAEVKERQIAYDAANELIKQHVPMIPLAHTNSGVGFKGEVLNVVIGPQNENFEEMSAPKDQLVFLQENEPESLWPGDESQTDTLRIARLLYSTLVQYEFGGTQIKPGLAEYWEYSPDLLEWTFSLRYNVKFSNGAALDANDVVATFAAQWDAASPNHTGNTGNFAYFKQFFGNFLNSAQ